MPEHGNSDSRLTQQDQCPVAWVNVSVNDGAVGSLGAWR